MRNFDANQTPSRQPPARGGPAQGWHREDIKAAVRKRGLSMDALSRRNGYCRSAVRMAIVRPWPKVEQIIAEFIGVPADLLWPERYRAGGRPLHSNPREHRSKQSSRRQIHKSQVR